MTDLANDIKLYIDGNSGDKNYGNYNSGDKNSGDFNSGNRNSGNVNTGNFNTGNFNSGNWNLGYGNSGNVNSGNFNTGNFNSGNFNSGNRNSGSVNSGVLNSGNFNSGDWNAGKHSSGVFNTDENPKIKMFDKESDWTYTDWIRSAAHDILFTCPYPYSTFVKKKDMIQEEIDNTDQYIQNWWNELPEEDKQVVMSLPNFDKDKFKQCTGIDV
jgi:hypothetical protein